MNRPGSTSYAPPQGAYGYPNDPKNQQTNGQGFAPQAQSYANGQSFENQGQANYQGQPSYQQNQQVQNGNQYGGFQPSSYAPAPASGYPPVANQNASYPQGSSQAYPGYPQQGAYPNPYPPQVQNNPQSGYGQNVPQATNPSYPQGSNPAYPQGSNPAYPQGSNPAYPQGSNPSYPQGSNPAYPQGPNPAYPQGPNPAYPQGFYQGQNPNPAFPPNINPYTPPSQPPQSTTPAARIDPKQIPRPLYPNTSTEIVKYFTRSGVAPPPSNAPFFVIDEGNCSPRFMRLTTNHIPATSELVDATQICVGAVIQPLANLASEEEPLNTVDFGVNGPLRCNRCRCYVNPFFKFIDNGKFFICNMCDLKNDVPREYQCNLDGNGFRRDKNDRAELCRGSIEFVAPKDYITREINSHPCYVFVIDVSYTSVVTGLLRVLLQSIRNCLDGLCSVQPNARVSVVTFDSNVHFYKVVDAKTKQPCNPQLISMNDVTSPFLPIPSGQILTDLSNPEGRSSFEKALELVEFIFSENKKEANAFGAACQASVELLTGLGGKIIVVQSNLPNVGLGALKMRDDVSLYGTDKEKTLLTPQIPFYDNLATQCADNAISVDMFVCPNSYVDLATTSMLSSSTAGQVFFFPGFHARKDGEALQNDLFHLLTRVQGYDAVMTVRCSNGLRVAEFYGNYYKRVPMELEIPLLDCDKAFAVRFAHENPLKTDVEMCFQCALLYTTSSGERRIRVHTLSVPVTPTMGVVFRNSDVDTVLNVSLKQVVAQLNTSTIVASRNALVQACINILHVYRKKCASATSVGQLILPESQKVLPLYTLSILKGTLLSQGLRADERAFMMHFVNSMSAYLCIPFVYPHLYSLHDLPDGIGCYPTTSESLLPPLRPLINSEITSDGIFVLDNGRNLLVLVGENVDPIILEQLFEESVQESGKLCLKAADSESSDSLCCRVNRVLDLIRRGRPTYAPVIVFKKNISNSTNLAVKQKVDDSQHFMSMLFEDGLADKDKEAATAPIEALSYVAFLCYLHRKIQDKTH